MSIEALPCIICGARLRNVYEDAQNQPSDGVACMTHGNYGSCVYDPVLTGEFLEFNICDACLVKAGEQSRIYTARAKQPIESDDLGVIGWFDVEPIYVLWHKDLPGLGNNIVVNSADDFRALGKRAHLFPDLEEEIGLDQLFE